MNAWSITEIFMYVILVYNNNSVGVNALTIQSPPPEFEAELSDSTLLALTNLSAAIRPFEYMDAEHLEERAYNMSTQMTRRDFKSITYTTYHRGHQRNTWQIRRMCFLMHNIFQSAMQDLRSYSDMRYLYIENLEYEVGFVTYEIISKYQNILELYDLVERRYAQQNDTNVAASTYMLYIYTNIVQLSYVVINLCNMLHEVERKYKFAKKTLFDDYHIEKLVDSKNGTKATRDPIREHNKRLAKQARERRRQRKKAMEDAMAAGHTTKFIRPKPKRSKHWEQIYGWSIEDGW